MSQPLYRRVGRSICTGENDWPPMLRDSRASEDTIQLVVDALNYCYEHGLIVPKPKALAAHDADTRNRALEEAADECDGSQLENQYEFNRPVCLMADRIRALKREKRGGE